MKHSKLLVLPLSFLLLLLTSCSADIPTSSSVQTGMSMNKDEDTASFQYYPVGPSQGADPSQIVKGFIEANTGVQNDFEVAREFLTPGFSQQWTPLNDVKVYQSDVHVEDGKDQGKVHASFNVSELVDSKGILDQEHMPGFGQDFELEKVDGQWRISKAPNSLFLSEQSFKTIFQAYKIYFFNRNYQMLTPDVRWFPQKSLIANTLIRELINGPQGWLKDSVHNEFSDESLSNDRVKVHDNLIQINLNGTSDIPPAEKVSRMVEQAKATLAQIISNQTNLSIVQGGKEIANSVINPQSDVPQQNVEEYQIGVANNSLKILKDQSVQDLIGYKDVSSLQASRPGISFDGKVVSLFSDNTFVLMQQGEEPKRLITGDFTEGSFDDNARAWLSEKNNSGKIITFTPSGVQTDIPVDWLNGKTVEDLKVSRDGTRVVVITSENGVYKMFIAGVQDDSNGNPKMLSLPVAIAEGISADRCTWMGSDSIAVLNSNATNVNPYIVQIGGTTTKLPIISNMQTISAGNNENEIFIADHEGGLYTLSGNAWVRKDITLKDPSFPG